MQFCGVFHPIDAVMEESAGLGWRLAALARFGVGRSFPAGVGASEASDSYYKSPTQPLRTNEGDHDSLLQLLKAPSDP
jgi:hypothetical protein